MNINYIKISNFYKNPHEVREDALRPEHWIDEHATQNSYPGIDGGDPYRYVHKGKEIAAILGVPLQPMGLGRFRSSKEGDVAIRHIHTDLSFYTTIVSLTLDDNPYGTVKTALWRHKETGLLRIGHEQVIDHNINWEMAIRENGINEDLWEIDTVLEYKFNEAIIIDGSLFHSPHPQGFGDCLENSRLTQNFFLSKILS